MSLESLKRPDSDIPATDFEHIIATLHSEWVTLRSLAYPDSENGGKTIGGTRARESLSGENDPGLDCLLRLEAQGVTPEDDNVARALFLLVAAERRYMADLMGSTHSRQAAIEATWQEFVRRSPRRVIPTNDLTPDEHMNQAEAHLQQVLERYEPLVTGAY